MVTEAKVTTFALLLAALNTVMVGDPLLQLTLTNSVLHKR